MIRTILLTNSERLQAVIDFLQRQKVATLDQLIEVIGCNERTVQRYIKQLNGITRSVTRKSAMASA